MSRKFVDAIWIRSRMNLTDARHEAAARRRVEAAARTDAELRAFHLLLTHPGTAARLEAMLEDNRRIDAAEAAKVVVDVEIVPTDPAAPRGPVVDVALEPKTSSSSLVSLTICAISQKGGAQ